MRKVTKRLLTACVAVLAVSACQDSVTVIQPDPPPPPPPPPAVDATVSILGLRAIPGPGSVNPTNVFGDINVALNVEEGDNTVTAIDLLFDGVPIGCQSINTNRVPGEGISLSAAGAADEVECFWDTNDVQGACDGSNLLPAFGNGVHTLGARITLDDGTTRTADNQQSVTLTNADFLLISHLAGQSLVSGGVNYYGGPADLDGDGTDDNVNQIAACPVSYNGTVVASIGVTPIQPVGNAADIGAGPGAMATDNAEPFLFDIDPADNDIASGNAVEDDVATNGLTGGHVFTIAGTILDDNGLNVTAQFGAPPSTGEIFLDFTAPQPNMGGASEITIGGASVIPGTWYSSGGFGLTFVTENGVGWSFGNGAQVDVGDCAEADNIDMDPSTAFVTVVSGATSMADHPEDDWESGGDGFAAADAGGLDCYLAELQLLADDLQNAFDLTGLGAAIQNVTADLLLDGDLDSYGADFTAPEASNAMPDANVVLNPDANADGGVCADAGDCVVLFDVADPDLASTDPGSGVDAASAAAEDETGAALGGSLAAFPPTLTVSIAGLADGPHTVTTTVPDFASPANELEFDIAFDLDDTAPVFGALNPAPLGSAGTDASAIVMSIGGTINDAHIIDSAVITVADATNGVCADGDDVVLAVGAAANQVDQNNVDITDGTGAITFSESFTIQQPSAAAITVNYCFTINAEDEAVLNDGTDQGNMSSLSSIVAVTWNAG